MKEIKKTSIYEDKKVANLYAGKTKLRAPEQYLFEKFFCKDDFILDLGCGTGRTTSHLLKMGCSVVAVDYAFEMVRKARNLEQGLCVVQMDGSALGFKEDSFNHTLFSFNGVDLLYPFSKRMDCFREMIRVTRPGGLIIFSSHNYYARLMRRFREKSFFSALRSTLSEFYVSGPLKKYWEGYITHQTQEGLMSAYMAKVSDQIRRFQSVDKEIKLIEVVGNQPLKETRVDIHRDSETVYYVWQKI